MRSLIKSLKIPIIQAPMAGGMNTPASVAAVCNFGGVGSFGFAYSTPAAIAQTLATTKLLTNGPINCNFFIFPEVEPPTADRIDAVKEVVSRIAAMPVDQLPTPHAPFTPCLEDQLAPVWEHRPALLTFHFGVPLPWVVERARALGILLGGTATTSGEAAALEAAGMDFIIAQGIEAGGHQGCFLGDEAPRSTLALVKHLAQQTSLPVIAAGGIMTGQHIHRAMQEGAACVHMGTAFLSCNEVELSTAHRRALRSDQPTALTAVFSGRRARCFVNRFVSEFEASGVPPLPFPVQNTLTGTMRRAAVERDDGSVQALYTGQNHQHSKFLPVTGMLTVLRQELDEAIASAES